MQTGVSKDMSLGLYWRDGHHSSKNTPSFGVLMVVESKTIVFQNTIHIDFILNLSVFVVFCM